jgi:ABC-type multidrug transport system fused ATPase/permease subunit
MLRLMPAVNRIMLSINNLKYGTAATDIVYGELQALEASAGIRQASDDRLRLRRELTVRNVSYRYPETAWWAIEGIDLTITRGEFVALVGPTGSGKSTLLDVLVGLLRPSEGVVQVDGVDIHGDVDAWHHSVGVVSQTVFLIDATVLQNIAFGVDEDEIDQERVEEVLRIARLEDFISSLPDGLRTRVGEHAVLLSGGQRQRIAIARALYRRPDLLVLDEGTSALDNHTEREILRALEPLRGELTVVAAAHQMATVQTCDRIVVIEGGRISDEGSLQDISSRNGRLWLTTGGDHRSTTSPSPAHRR